MMNWIKRQLRDIFAPASSELALQHCWELAEYPNCRCKVEFKEENEMKEDTEENEYVTLGNVFNEPIIPKKEYESYKEMQECAVISLNAVLHKVLKCKSDLLDNNCNKEDIYRMLNSIEFDILLINDKNNHIERNLK